MVSKFVDWRNTILNLRELRMGSTKITATPDEINQVCDGVGPTATAANLTALTDVKDDLLAASGGGSGILRVSGKIAHAALLTLPTAPVPLVAAQGADTVIVPHRVTLLRSIAGGQQYTAIDADAVLAIGLQETFVAGNSPDIALLAQLVNGNGTGRTDVTALLGTGGNIVLHALVPDATWNGDWPGMVGGSVISSADRNKSLQLFLLNNPLGVPTNLSGGNAANTLCWTVWYSVVSTDPATYS
jgi:hypothetical protein